MGIETVLLGTAIAGAGASAYSGSKAASAAEKGAKQSADVQRYMYDTTREDTAPYREYGQGALEKLASLYGISRPQQPMSFEEFMASDQYKAPVATDGGGAAALVSGRHGGGLVSRGITNAVSGGVDRSQYDQYVKNFTPTATTPAAPDYSDFYNSPDYQFALEQGQRATEQMLARDGKTGGAALKALTRFGQGLASQQLSNYKNSLASLAGVGQTATQNLGSLGVATGQGIGQDYRAAGDARGSSYLNTGAAINNVANTYGQTQLLKAGGYI